PHPAGERGEAVGQLRDQSLASLDEDDPRVEHPGQRQHRPQRGPGGGERQVPGDDLGGEAVERVGVVGAHDDDLHPATAQLGTQAARQRPVGVQRHVPAAEQDHAQRPGHAGTGSGRAAGTGRPKLVGGAGVKPRWRIASASSRDRSRTSSPGLPRLKCPRCPDSASRTVSARQANERPRGRPTTGELSRSEGTATMPPSSTVTSGRVATRSGAVLRGCVASRTTAPGLRWWARSRLSTEAVRRTTTSAPATASTDPAFVVGTREATSAARHSRRPAPRATRSSCSTARSRASERTTAEPTLPVAPTTATRPPTGPTRPSSTSRTWRSPTAAVKALPLVRPPSVRWRRARPPAVTGAVSAPSPTRRAPRCTAWSTARATRTAPRAGSARRCPAAYGTRTISPSGPS